MMKWSNTHSIASQDKDERLAQLVERPLSEREVVIRIPQPHHTIDVKMVLAASLLTLALKRGCARKMILFVLLLYVPSQQLWSLRDGQLT